MKRLELTVPTSLLDDLEILSDRFFRHNRSVQVLQSFSLRPQTNALIVRVHRKGPFKDEATVRRRARAKRRTHVCNPVALQNCKSSSALNTRIPTFRATAT